jgi:dihydrodiol dehydrogenase / D-xylose 1-dehydrogenase (NADP)
VKPGLRWGVFGAGIIAHKLIDAVRQSPGSEVLAIASKSIDKARLFSEKYEIDACSDYQVLANRADIDVIYIATTHNYHYENALLALNSGKHVLVEKPFTVNAQEARLLVDVARQKQLFLMEAIWVRFLPSIRLLRDYLRNGVIGEIRYVSLSFGGIASAEFVGRLTDPDLAGGVTLDMGIYPITLVNFLLGEQPQRVQSLSRMSPTGVDELAVYQFQYPSNCIASIGTSFSIMMKNEAMVYGTKGNIEFPNFQQGQSFTIDIHDGSNEIRSTETITEKNASNGFIYQVAEVADCIRNGRLESESIPLAETVATMELMDTMRAQWGFKYPFE